MPPAERRRAFDAGLAAYDRGDFFLAHELLEPAWMGTDDLGERGFLQGLIKLAAAFVHASRGNPVGVGKNLRGARDHLLIEGSAQAGRRHGVHVRELVDRMDERLVELERAGASLLAIRIPRVADDAGDDAVDR